MLQEKILEKKMLILEAQKKGMLEEDDVVSKFSSGTIRVNNLLSKCRNNSRRATKVMMR